MNIEKRDDKKRSEGTEGRNSSGERNGNNMKRLLMTRMLETAMNVRKWSVIVAGVAVVFLNWLPATTAACENPYDVVVYYIVPDGETDNSAAVLGDVLAAQTFYRNQMASRGFGERTFKIAEFITVPQDQNGWTTEDFEDADARDLWRWVDAPLNIYKEETYHRIYLFLLEGVSQLLGGACGIADSFVVEGWKAPPLVGGYAFVGMDTQCPDRVSLIAHELGHTFGLDHSLDSKATMYPTAAENQRSFSEKECLWLDGSRYFNDDHGHLEDTPGIQMLGIRASQRDGEPSVELEFRLTSHEGVYMFQLSRMSDKGRVAMVELDTWQTGVLVNIPRSKLVDETSLYASILDAKGSFGWQKFLFGIPPLADPQPSPLVGEFPQETVTAWAILKRGER